LWVTLAFYTMAPVGMRSKGFEGHLSRLTAPLRRHVHCEASPKAPRVSQTVARKVQVTPETDFANTPNRRYVLPTGDPFPLGPLFYRKTTSKQVRVLSTGALVHAAVCGQIVSFSACTARFFSSTYTHHDLNPYSRNITCTKSRNLDGTV
jgi:hypothetical protein